MTACFLRKKVVLLTFESPDPVALLCSVSVQCLNTVLQHKMLLSRGQKRVTIPKRVWQCSAAGWAGLRPQD